jgi:hypothetical protein
VTVTLSKDQLAHTLERAYLLAISDQDLPAIWVTRAEQLRESPSVGFIAAIGSVLLAKATNDRIDAMVIQKQEGSAGAFSLRSASTVLASRRRALSYDIGSSSDRDPINHGTLISSRRWDLALHRISSDHKPFFQLLLQWLPDINRMDEEQATAALAAYLRVRHTVSSGAAANRIALALDDAPTLTSLVDVLDGFVSATPEGGARGMALVAAAYEAAGFAAKLPSRNDPRRIDITIRRDGMPTIGAEVKQADTSEVTADTLAQDAIESGMQRALLAVLPPGTLASFDRAAAIRRAEQEHGVVLRISSGVRELLHEAFSAGVADLDVYCAALPHAFGTALSEIRVAKSSVETWVAIASRWQ